jgi:hypothetical protein
MQLVDEMLKASLKSDGKIIDKKFQESSKVDSFLIGCLKESPF